MALTVTTDLSVLTTAESTTNWVSYGSGGSGAMAIEPDFSVQSSNCISRGVSGTTRKGQMYNHAAGIDFTTGTHKDKLVYIWMKTSTPGLCNTRVNGGQTVILGSGAVTPGDAAGVWSMWYVDGSDSIVDTNGWVCYVINPQSTPSATFGGGVNTAAVTYYGGTQLSTTTAKGQNFGVDQIAYGRGEIYVSGTVTTAGEGFKEIAAVAYDSAKTNRWGIITVRAGVLYVRGKIIIGDASANTTFSSRGETVVWETPGYYNGTNVVKLIPDASTGATAGADGKTTYNGLAIRGGATTTNIDFGVIAGSESGRSGSNFLCAKNSNLTTPAITRATITVDNSTMALNIYSSTFVGFEGQIDLTGTGVVGDDYFASTFNGCGRIDSNMEIKNAFIINSVAAADDGAFIWDGATNLQKCTFANNSRAIVFEGTTGTPFAFTGITFSGNTFDVRNESNGAIVINVSEGTTPTVENIGGSSTTVNAGVVTEIVVTDIDTGSPIEGARVLVLVANGANFPYQASVSITSSGTTATVSHAAHGYANGQNVNIQGADQDAYNGCYSITVTGGGTYTYAMTESAASPATGASITATTALINTTTSASGIANDTRSFTNNQPVTGRVRLATGSFYRQSPITDTIDKDNGKSINVQLIPDI